jgi:hypothetical protein
MKRTSFQKARQKFKDLYELVALKQHKKKNRPPLPSLLHGTSLRELAM